MIKLFNCVTTFVEIFFLFFFYQLETLSMYRVLLEKKKRTGFLIKLLVEQRHQQTQSIVMIIEHKI